MKIQIIRHAKVDMKWPDFMTGEEFDEANTRYDASPIKAPKEVPRVKLIGKLCVSELTRTHETAQLLFGYAPYKVTPLLNEVPMTAATYGGKKHYRTVWNIWGRLQWFFGNRQQKESRRKTKKRAEYLLKTLIAADEDCTLVTHGFFMRVLVKVLKEQGFVVEGEKTAYENLGVVMAVRNDAQK